MSFYVSMFNSLVPQLKQSKGRLEHLHDIALGFCNLNHYILSSLTHSEQFTYKINAL